MSTPQAVIKALATFERTHADAGAAVFVHIKAAAAPDLSLSLADARAHLHTSAAAEAGIQAVTAHIKVNGQLQEIVPVYPAQEEEGHTGSCCGGCGG